MILVDGTATKDSLKALRYVLHGAIREGLALAVEETEAQAKGTDLFHDQSGKTRASIRHEIHGDRAWVQAGGAARFLENGTPPHVISARRTSALRFRVNGQTLFRRTVQHPGTAERPFMRQARDRGELAFDYALELRISDAIQSV